MHRNISGISQAITPRTVVTCFNRMRFCILHMITSRAVTWGFSGSFRVNYESGLWLHIYHVNHWGRALRESNRKLSICYFMHFVANSQKILIIRTPFDSGSGSYWTCSSLLMELFENCNWKQNESQWESLIDLKCTFLDCGRKPENLELTRICTDWDPNPQPSRCEAAAPAAPPPWKGNQFVSNVIHIHFLGLIDWKKDGLEFSLNH